ncbi:MAG: hypothetical protein SFV54_04320 [Bryobacteraceae bacterium]|nr:hypothetical protein [Bryobacteraceae bacterium]
MKLGEWFDEGVRSGRSGIEGAVSTFRQEDGGAEMLRAARTSLVVASAGVVVGAVAGYLSSKERDGGKRSLAMALTGAALGVAGAMIWQTRGLTGSVLRGAARGVGREHDNIWLEKNPVAYG